MSGVGAAGMLVRMETSRLMWALFEPIHDVTYFTPEARQVFEAANLRGYWRGYFAGRAAPLGAVGAEPVVAAFHGFAPAMVARALPDVWQRAAPEAVLRARSDGAVEALARLTAHLPGDAIARAADVLGEAAGRLDPTGTVLGAANAALPLPDEPTPRLWQAATTLREHRGDGHVAALRTAGLGGCEVLVYRCAHDLSRDFLQPNRGWTDEEWDAATRRLVEDGWLDDNHAPTPWGLGRFGELEAETDRLAAPAWAGVDIDRVWDALAPVSNACRAALPTFNPVGLPVPERPDQAGRSAATVDSPDGTPRPVHGSQPGAAE
jgi:hypothetical protein